MCLLALFSCSRQKPKVEDQIGQAQPRPNRFHSDLSIPTIRVVVSRGATSFSLLSSGGAAKVLNENGREIGIIAKGQPIQIGAQGCNLRSPDFDSGRSLPAVRIISSQPSGDLILDQKFVASEIDIFFDPKSSNVSTVVVHLNLEDYLLGVLEGEVPVNKWHDQALQAQAITSRTYALNQMKMHSDDPYDVVATVMDQVFKPAGSQNPRVVRAVEATLGQALTEDGRLFSAYFHSTCGGSTVEASRIFQRPNGTSNVLMGVPCSFCTESPAYRWSAELEIADIEKKLRDSDEFRKAKTIRGSIKAIEPLQEIGHFPRSTVIRVSYDEGQVDFGAQNFRILVGAIQLKSSAITSVRRLGSSFRFEGGGFGHGAGLCQYGSQGMGLKGYSARQILGFYFPGGELATIYGRKVAHESPR